MTAAAPIRVMLADDHSVVRQSLRLLLDAERDFSVVGEAENGREAVEMARRLSPDVILMDISMPVLNGLEATHRILAANPSAKVIIFSAYTDDEYVERVREIGPAGFLAKQTLSDTLAKTIREVFLGRAFFSPSAAKRGPSDQTKARDRSNRLKTKAARLTSRESAILQLLAGGAVNRQVALKLRISIAAVEKHLRLLMGKLKVRRAADLARFAIAPALVASSVQLTIT